MIGVIFRTGQTLEEADVGWVPEKLNPDQLTDVLCHVLGYLPASTDFMHTDHDVCIQFSIDNFEEPRVISFNCSLNAAEELLIRKIADSLKCKIFDSEMTEYL